MGYYSTHKIKHDTSLFYTPKNPKHKYEILSA